MRVALAQVWRQISCLFWGRQYGHEILHGWQDHHVASLRDLPYELSQVGTNTSDVKRTPVKLRFMGESFGGKLHVNTICETDTVKSKLIGAGELTTHEHRAHSVSVDGGWLPTDESLQKNVEAHRRDCSPARQLASA